MPDDTTSAPTSDPAKETMEQALNDGQLDPESDDGHTPADEDSGDGVAGGHTPDSGPTDAEGSSPQSDEPEQEGATDSTDSASEPEDEVEDVEEEEVATDQDQDSDEGDEEEDDSNVLYFDGEYSQYKTEEEAKHAIDKKDEIIYRTRDKLKEERKRREQAQSQVETLREAMPQDQQKEMVVRQYMAEELGEEDQELLELSEEDLESQPEKEKRLMKARARAEARFENELEQAQERQEDQLRERKKKFDEASEYVTDWVSEDKFNAHSAEDRIRLQEYFQGTEEDEQYNRAERAVLLYSDYGPEVAEHYLEGVRQDFLSEQSEAIEETMDESEPDPKPQPTPSSDGPEQTDSEEEQEFESDSPLETLIAAQA